MKKLLSWLLILAMLMMGGVALAQGTNTAAAAAATEEEDDGWFDVQPVLLPLLVGEGMDLEMIMSGTESRAIFTVITALELSMCETFGYEVDILSPTYIGSASDLFVIMYFEAEAVEASTPYGSSASAENVGVFVFYDSLDGSLEYMIMSKGSAAEIEMVMNEVCPGTWYENGLLDIYNATNDLLEILS